MSATTTKSICKNITNHIHYRNTSHSSHSTYHRYRHYRYPSIFKNNKINHINKQINAFTFQTRKYTNNNPNNNGTNSINNNNNNSGILSQAVSNDLNNTNNNNNNNNISNNSFDKSQHAVLSTFDMFTIGIGPSSSHTVGPMRAAKKFLDRIDPSTLSSIKSIKVELFGSLACTGLGHGTDFAVLMGLEGETPEEIDPKYAFQRSKQIAKTRKLRVNGNKSHTIQFTPLQHLIWHMNDALPFHSNGMRFNAYNSETEMNEDSLIVSEEWYSLGGGFVARSTDVNKHNAFRYLGDHTDTDIQANYGDFIQRNGDNYDNYGNNSDNRSDIVNATIVTDDILTEADDLPPMLFSTAKDLFRLARAHQLKISQIVFENELMWRSSDEIKSHLMKIWSVMHASIENGINTRGILPGEIQATRRASLLNQKLLNKTNGSTNTNTNTYTTDTTYTTDHYSTTNNTPNSTHNTNITSNDITGADTAFDRSLDALNSIIGANNQDWLYCWAMAVNEENAAGGKVVTAPTNGASGVIPSVIKYYTKFHRNPCDEGIQAMLLTAAAVGMLFKRGASLSAAEVGCQGEVGVAASMAAAALCEVMGGTLAQVESAAEIAMEHSLGLTCDPIGGYVQVPCIERNAIGAAKAVASARMALLGDGKQIVSLDAVIQTMRQTGEDMSHKYKETALGGLAVNVPVC